VAKRLMSSTGAIAAAASYAILSVSSSVLGLAAHATHFVVLPVLAGIFLLLSRDLTTKSVLISGILFGIALLMKQPAIFFICFGAIYLLFRHWRAKMDLHGILMQNTLFIIAAALPLAAVSLWLWHAGVFGKFWLWTVLYAREYGTLVSIPQAFATFLQSFRPILGVGWPLLTLAVLGVVAIVADRSLRPSAFLILSFLTFSGIATCAGFYFRRHYFIFALPAVCLLVGAAISSGENVCSRLARPFRLLGLVIFGASLTIPLLAERQIFLTQHSSNASRMIYGANPFPEAVRLAKYLRQNSNPTDTIAVIGSEPEIYFYAHRHSATGYIYTYELMEPQKFATEMQREMIREIETARPKYLVFVVASVSWLEKADSDREILTWVKEETAAKFRLNGLINILSPERTDDYLPLLIDPKSIQLSQNYLLIFERKT
jgi:hypothetical protein